jgi:hypothetical protein
MNVIIELGYWLDHGSQIKHLLTGRGSGEGQLSVISGVRDRRAIHGDADRRDREDQRGQETGGRAESPRHQVMQQPDGRHSLQDLGHVDGQAVEAEEPGAGDLQLRRHRRLSTERNPAGSKA